MHRPKKSPKEMADQATSRASKAKRRKAMLNHRWADKPKLEKRELVLELLSTILAHFAHLFDWMREIDDVRKRASDYDLAAHLMACLGLFLFKSGSRNQFNQLREDPEFKKTSNVCLDLTYPTVTRFTTLSNCSIPSRSSCLNTR